MSLRSISAKAAWICRKARPSSVVVSIGELPEVVKTSRKPGNQIGILVSCAYFGMAKRFFAPPYVAFRTFVGIYPGTKEAFIWAVTREGQRWQRSNLGAEAITEAVSALRLGLAASSVSSP